MANTLSDVDGSILDFRKSIEEFDNSILELHTEAFDRIQERLSDQIARSKSEKRQ